MKRIKNIKPWMIAVGIFAVIGILTSVCAAFPPEGIGLTESVRLHFPSVTEMLQGDEEEEEGLSPEELMAQQEEEARQLQEDEQFKKFFTENANRIHFPNNDCTYFDPVYAALEAADSVPMHIVHYGDSQLEEDRMSCNLRLALQQHFGGGGNGLLPWRESLYSQTINMYSKRELTRYMIYGPQSGRRPGGSRMYGPMGMVSMLDGSMTVSISPKKRNGEYTSSHFFNKLTVLSKSESPIRVSAQGLSQSSSTSGSMQMTTIELKDSTHTLAVSIDGKADIYGFIVEQNTGVSVDNIPLRGCSGTIFGSIDGSQLTRYFDATNTKLVIMQFGGNSVPYLKSESAITNYVNSCRKQVAIMKNLAPGRCIMWIGPSDMGRRGTYPMLGKVDEALCKMVNEEGCAYWSLFEAMGGAGSMARWVEAKPTLAGKDYIHFTRLGATRAGEMLTDAFLTGYRYYSFRTPGEHKDLGEAQNTTTSLPDTTMVVAETEPMEIDSMADIAVVLPQEEMAAPAEAETASEEEPTQEIIEEF